MERNVDSSKPQVVCLCGSTRFKDAFIQANKDETLKGKIVLSVGLFGHVEGLDMEGKCKTDLDQLHLRKIDLADEILVLNVGGYIGSSTSKEVKYAEANNKIVSYLESSDQEAVVHDIKIPKLPDQDETADVCKVYVSVGQHVKRDDPIFDIETDKVILEIVAKCDGIISHVLVHEDQQVSSYDVAVIFIATNTEKATAEIPVCVYLAESHTENFLAKVPQIPNDQGDTRLVNVCFNVGEHVKSGQTLFEVENEKVILEIEAACNGYVIDIMAELGTTVKSMQAIMQLSADIGEVPSTPTKNKREETKDAVVKKEPYTPIIGFAVISLCIFLFTLI